jgi:hypothetical protein
MPVRVRKSTVTKKGKKVSVFRVVESSTGKLVMRGSTAIDGGGHRTRPKAVAQVNAVNLSELRKKGRKGIPPARKKRR